MGTYFEILIDLFLFSKFSYEMRHSLTVSVVHLRECNKSNHFYSNHVSSRKVWFDKLPAECRHTHDQEDPFWKLLGGRPKFTKTADEGGKRGKSGRLDSSNPSGYAY